MSNSIVEIGDKVKLVLDGAVRDLEIVDISEANPLLGKISFLSPVAKAILGKRYPARVKLKTPTGKIIECHLMRPAD